MNKTLSSAVVAAIAATAASGAANSQAVAGYSSGDFHNHTTCSDGSTSVETLVRESLTYLDWFIQVGHSGADPRDCRFDDFSGEFPNYETGNGEITSPGKWWQNSVGVENIKGDEQFTTSWGCDASEGTPGVPDGECLEMWRWQSLQEYNNIQIVEQRELANKPAFLGLEWVVPGHEHSSNAIITGQYEEVSNTDAIAQYEYCFARNSDDTSQGGGQGWTCEISEEANQALIDRFAQFPEQGSADYNGTLGEDGVNISDGGDHVKSVASVYWMQENFPGDSFVVPAHLERQGSFIPNDDEGYNVEHLRDYNNAAPDVAYGFESQPGHQAQSERGSYNAGRPTSGLWTWGGTGCYAAAEAARPGLDFDGNELTPADFAADGRFPEVDDNEDPAKVTLCRPGVRTMWDAMLSEGRNYWFFGSSDWHDAGDYGPFEGNRSTNDFIPGAYQKNLYFVRPAHPDNPAKDIVDSLHSGNGYVTQADIIDRLNFVACDGNRCATMGGTLRVAEGTEVTVRIILRDPEGVNENIPYSFDNPSLLQIGVEQPLNQPKLAHVDLIKGEVHGKIDPLTDYEEYTNPLAPETTVLERQWLRDELAGRGQWKRAVHSINVTEDSYVRLRGSTLPPGTPNERDVNGNPLEDKLSDNILCEDPACPPHLPENDAGQKYISFDVEAFSDSWFYANPIFIQVVDFQTLADAE